MKKMFVLFVVLVLVMGIGISCKKNELKPGETVLTELAVKDFGLPQQIQIWRGVIMNRTVNIIGIRAVVFVESPKDDSEHFFSEIPVVLAEWGLNGRERILLGSNIKAGREIYFQMISSMGTPSFPSLAMSVSLSHSIGIEMRSVDENDKIVNPKSKK